MADLAPVTPIGAPSAVVTGLRAPWSIAFLGETALISLRDDARILEVLDGGGTREVGIIEGVRHGGKVVCSAWPSMTAPACTSAPPGRAATASSATC